MTPFDPEPPSHGALGAAALVVAVVQAMAAIGLALALADIFFAVSS